MLLDEIIQALEIIQAAIIHEPDLETTKELLEESESILVDVVSVEEFLLPYQGSDVVRSVQAVVKALQDRIDSCKKRRGRPWIPIDESSLSALIDAHFSRREIGQILQASSKTIQRRIVAYGLDEQIAFSGLDDCQLDEITRQFVGTHPNSGERCYSGFLRAAGLHIQRQRVRESLLRIDPSGV